MNKCSHEIKITSSQFISYYFHALDRIISKKSHRKILIEKYLRTHSVENLSNEFITKLVSGSILRGFFQDVELVRKSLPNYLEEIHDFIAKLCMEKSLSKAIEGHSTLQVIHARRGDYLDINLEVGVITLESQIAATDTRFSVKICTDSKTLVTESECQDLNVTVFGAEDFNTWQTLALMSQARVLICGNSTLSWWAGMLHSRAEQVVYFPKPWTVQPTELFSKLLYPQMHFYKANFKDNT